MRVEIEPLWVRPALPPAGSEEDALYAAVGRVICQWSDVEAGMCLVYQFLVSRPFDRSAVREYGAGAKVRDRVGAVRKAADKHFIGQPNQDHEGHLYALLDRVEEFAAHRNDVAHATVRPWQWIGPPAPSFGTFTFCLLPSHFDPKRFTNDKPDFIYNAEALEDLSSALFRLSQSTVFYRTDWWHADGRPKN